MILYMDTSALLARYFKGPGSMEVISKWKEADGIVISSVAYKGEQSDCPDLLICYN